MFRNFMMASTALALTVSAWPALAATLSNGSGEGDVTLDVSAYGRSDFASFDPVGPIEDGGVFFDSAVLISQGNNIFNLGGGDGFNFDIDTADAGAQILSQSGTALVSRFTLNQLDFTLTQTLSDTVNAGQQVGSIFTQQFQITNLAGVTNSFDLYRYLDGDLYLTDETLDDGGGVIGSGPSIVLYQTDLADGATSQGTFVGITAVGGTAPDTSRFSINACCGVDAPLDDMVEGDTNGDNIVDSAYDVTLTLRNAFSIASGATQTYTTTTIFGEGELPTPGSRESLPLLPDPNTPDTDAFVFTIPVVDVTPGETIWIDPVIAVGYIYTVVGADFASVTAPSLATVNDGDAEYTLSFGGNSITLAAGGTYFFGVPVTSFTITGIDADLMLDPDNQLAFVTGVALTNVSLSGNVLITQNPITIDTDPLAPVPLPASGLLLLGGWGALVGMRRRRRG